MSDGKKGELQFMTVTSPRLDVSESNEHIENLLETTYVDIEKANKYDILSTAVGEDLKEDDAHFKLSSNKYAGQGKQTLLSTTVNMNALPSPEELRDLLDANEFESSTLDIVRKYKEVMLNFKNDNYAQDGTKLVNMVMASHDFDLDANQEAKLMSILLETFSNYWSFNRIGERCDSNHLLYPLMLSIEGVQCRLCCKPIAENDLCYGCVQDGYYICYKCSTMKDEIEFDVTAEIPLKYDQHYGRVIQLHNNGKYKKMIYCLSYNSNDQSFIDYENNRCCIKQTADVTEVLNKLRYFSEKAWMMLFVDNVQYFKKCINGHHNLQLKSQKQLMILPTNVDNDDASTCNYRCSRCGQLKDKKFGAYHCSDCDSYECYSCFLQPNIVCDRDGSDLYECFMIWQNVKCSFCYKFIAQTAPTFGCRECRQFYICLTCYSHSKIICCTEGHAYIPSNYSTEVRVCFECGNKKYKSSKMFHCYECDLYLCTNCFKDKYFLFPEEEESEIKEKKYCPYEKAIEKEEKVEENTPSNGKHLLLHDLFEENFVKIACLTAVSTVSLAINNQFVSQIFNANYDTNNNSLSFDNSIKVVQFPSSNQFSVKRLVHKLSTYSMQCNFIFSINDKQIVKQCDYGYNTYFKELKDCTGINVTPVCIKCERKVSDVYRGCYGCWCDNECASHECVACYLQIRLKCKCCELLTLMMGRQNKRCDLCGMLNSILLACPRNSRDKCSIRICFYCFTKNKYAMSPDSYYPIIPIAEHDDPHGCIADTCVQPAIYQSKSLFCEKHLPRKTIYKYSSFDVCFISCEISYVTLDEKYDTSIAKFNVRLICTLYWKPKLHEDWRPELNFTNAVNFEKICTKKILKHKEVFTSSLMDYTSIEVDYCELEYDIQIDEPVELRAYPFDV